MIREVTQVFVSALTSSGPALLFFVLFIVVVGPFAILASVFLTRGGKDLVKKRMGRVLTDISEPADLTAVSPKPGEPKSEKESGRAA